MNDNLQVESWYQRALAERSPAEAFAEIGGHVILDRQAHTYLPKALIAFVRARVLNDPR
jgi:hypothetical protein